jgi:dinuclear metal center YbgI/SA1388 family protein
VGADLLVTHHPLLKEGPASFADDDADGKRIASVLRAGLAVYSMHTNFDIVEGGVNDILAQRLGLRDLSVLVPSGSLRKVVVFVPREHADGVFLAMANAGAGHVGAYSECSFRATGEGTFTAPADAHPALGKAGRANLVEEIRLETTVPREALKRVVEAMKAAHPYEEIAYDVYVLEGARTDVGLGRIGRIDPMQLDGFAAECARRLNVATVRWAGRPESKVARVAVCGGSGGGFVETARARGADVFVTGDLRYHDSQRALAMGLALVDAGHQGTEALAVPALAEMVSGALVAVGYTGRVNIYESAPMWRPAGG